MGSGGESLQSLERGDGVRPVQRTRPFVGLTGSSGTWRTTGPSPLLLAQRLPPPGGVGGGSLAPSSDLHDLGRFRLVFQVRPHRLPHGAPSLRMVARPVLSALVTLVPLQRRVPAPADHPWVEQGGSSSPGILLLGVRPSVDISERVHSRPVETGPRPMAATPPDLVPLLRFLTAPAACSALRVAGLLHPAADPGVRRVSGRTSHSLRSGGGADLSRRRVSHPSEGCSSPTAAPCRHGRCLLAVTPRVSRFRGPPGWPGFEALLHRRVRYARPPLPVAVARASLGLVSLQGTSLHTSFRFPWSPPTPSEDGGGRKTREAAGGSPFTSRAEARAVPGDRQTFPRTRFRKTSTFPPSPCRGRRTGALQTTRGRQECRIQEGEATDTTRSVHRSPGDISRVACRARTRNCLLR
jgi:hypothetical protein